MKHTLVIAALAAFSVCATAHAFINPSFTPVDLIRQSDVVLLLEFKSVDDDGMAVASVQKVLKGEFGESEITFDLLAGAFEAQGRAVMQLITDGNRQALLFAGMFEQGDMQMADPDAGPSGYLHLAGQWIVLASWDGIWEMEKTDARMLGTWAGGTDMLLRAVDYILSDPDADVPVRSGVTWAPEQLVGQVPGAIHDVQAVDVDGDGSTYLFVAAESGDRLFGFSGGAFNEVTAKRKLTSRSVAAAWGDFDRDGRLDLASWDGKSLNLHSQQADGAFSLRAYALGDSCQALTTLTADAEGHLGLLVSTQGAPQIAVPRSDGKLDVRPVSNGPFPADEVGEAGRCFAADFDGDGWTDILQLCARAGLFYKGTGPGRFASPAQTAAATGGGVYGACIGDYDADGLLDVFVAGDRRNRLWQNQGDGRFANLLGVSGEIAYISKPGGVDAATGDFSNDGRQDILLAYGVRMSPHLFFNRGFRSFGHARMVDLMEQKLLPEAAEGQQAACLADLNGDGALDMALALNNGQLWVFPRAVGEDGALAAAAAVSLSSPSPVNVWAWKYERPLGAWCVRPGEPGAFVGLNEAGPVTIRWRLPGGRMQETELIVEEGRAHVFLDQQ